MDITEDDLRKRKESCRRFVFYGSTWGLTVPLLLSGVIYSIKYIPLFLNGYCANLSIIFIVIVYFILLDLTLLPWISHYHYDRIQCKTKNIDSLLKKIYINKATRRVDMWLYIIALFTVLSTGVMVYLTGGIERSFFSYYFFFIPSAIAISFEAHRSLQLTCIFGAVIVLLLYIFPHIVVEIEDDLYYTIVYLGVIIAQFASIYLLECFHKKITKPNEI